LCNSATVVLRRCFKLLSFFTIITFKCRATKVVVVAVAVAETVAVAAVVVVVAVVVVLQ